MRRRTEYFHIAKHSRIYDRRTDKFTFNIAYETATRITSRTMAVAQAFGLGIDQQQKFIIYDNVELKIGPKDVVYLTGESGSGKSVLLQAIRKDLEDEAIDVVDIRIDVDKPLIETVGRTVEEALELLSKVGLNDAFLFLHSYDQLSDGQKYRYRIAKLIESRKQWWILDEFAATLDRDTAKIVAFNLQKLARQQGKAVIAATTHTDLFEDLKPSVYIHKRFGKEITVDYYLNEPVQKCSLTKEMQVKEGSCSDWRRLADFHYRGHNIAAPRKIFCLKRDKDLCGVIVYCYPPPTCFGRRCVLPQMSMRELNERLSIISRVVIHPKYRSIGLGSQLVRETLSLAGTDYVEMPAVMAKYNPFAEKAGMKKITEQPPPKEASKIVETLQQLGFDAQLLGSTDYVTKKLQTLENNDLSKLTQVLIHQKHIRLMKFFFSDRAFGAKAAYADKIKKASINELAHLIKICSFLMQTKVYLFWKKLTE